MAAKYPHPAGTGERVNFKDQTPHILQHPLQHPRRRCANCGAPLYTREFHHCRPCRSYLALWRALVEMARISGQLS